MLLSTSVATRLEPPRGRAAKRRGRGVGTTCPHAASPTPASAAISISASTSISAQLPDALGVIRQPHAVFGLLKLEFDLPDGDGRRLRSLHLDQSSFASRRTAGASGVVRAVLVNPGAEAGRAHGKRDVVIVAPLGRDDDLFPGLLSLTTALGFLDFRKLRAL